MFSWLARHGGEFVSSPQWQGKCTTRPRRKSRSGHIRRGRGWFRVPLGKSSVARVRGREVAWGFDTGGEHDSREVGSRGKGGLNTVGSPTTSPYLSAGVDTAVSIEREVVSGHAYAILAPETVIGGRCGHDKPTYLSVDGV